MTVCVGLKLPWPEGLQKWEPQYPGPEMVALACDSRLTSRWNGATQNDGEKLFRVCANGMYTYSGSTWVGEGLIRALVSAHNSGFGRLAPDLWLTNFGALDAVREGLEYVHRRALTHDGLSRESARVRILAAASDELRVRLVQFDTGRIESPYTPLECRGGVCVIGDDKPRIEVLHTCENLIRSGKRYDSDPGYWALKPLMALNQVVSSGRHATIGGLTQVAILTPGPNQGVEFLSHALVPYLGDTTWGAPITTEIEGPRWVQRQNERQTGATRGHLPFADFPSVSDPLEPGEQGPRDDQVRHLSPSAFHKWAQGRISDILKRSGWAVGSPGYGPQRDDLFAFRGGQKWLVTVVATRAPAEPLVTESVRERVVNAAVDWGMTPVVALYWFHNRNGNKLFRLAVPFYDALNPET